MTRMTDEELHRQVDAFVRRQAEEQSLITPYDDPREIGRRAAREAFKKREKTPNEQASESGAA